MSALTDLIMSHWDGTFSKPFPRLDTSIYWWSVVMRKNMPGMPKPNPIGGEHLYVAAIGRHDAKSRDALVSGTGMTPSGAFDKALELLALKEMGDAKAEDDAGSGRSKKPGTGRRSRAHSKYKRQRLQAET